MDQPTTPSPQWSSPESVIAYIVGIVAAVVANVVRGKFQQKMRRAKADEVIAVASAAAEPSLQKENIGFAVNLIEQYRAESDEIKAEARKELAECRSQLDKERTEKYEWRILTETLKAEIAQLKNRVAELERRQIGKSTDIR